MLVKCYSFCVLAFFATSRLSYLQIVIYGRRERKKYSGSVFTILLFIFFYGFAMNNSSVLWHTLIAPHYFLLLQAEIISYLNLLSL